MAEPTTIDSIRYFGDYLILGEIARGGMGVVYLARQTNLQREVALKLIRAGTLAARRDLEQFRIEAEAAAALSHPHIVRIFEAGEHQGQPFVAMEWIEGESLAGQLAAGQWKMEPASARARQRTIAGLLVQLAAAVQHAHQRGVIHRDLKPGNILLNAKGEPFLTDFGLAKLIEGGMGLTQTGQILGTPSYMSPEQAVGRTKDVTIASDIYGLGAILYELLAGEPPFRGDSAAAILKKVIEEEPIRPSKVDSRQQLLPRTSLLSPDLETICLKCLEKEPARRYVSAQALQEDLERWLRGEPILARRITPAERFWKWVRRHPALAALLTTLMIVAVASAGAITWQWRRAEQGWSNVRQANSRLMLQRAEEHFASGDSSTALATLARALRDDTGNRVIEERLVNALRVRRFLLPSAVPVNVFDLAQSPQTLARSSKQGAVTADARNATNIVLTGLRGAEGAVTLALPQPEIIRHVRFSPDGHWFAAAVSAAGVRVWDLRSRQIVSTLQHPVPATVVEFAPASSVLATGAEDGAVRLWDLIRSEPVGTIPAHRGPVNALGFSTDGRVLFSAGEDGLLRVWYPGRATARAAESVQLGEPIDALALTPPNTLAVRLRGNGVRQFFLPKFPTARDLAMIDPTLADRANYSLRAIELVLGVAATHFHTQPVACTNLSPDGRLLVTASVDGTARVWDARTHRAVTPPMVHSSTVNHALFSSDGLRLATSTAGQRVRVWDAATGAALTDEFQAADSVFSVRFRDDGLGVIASNGQHWPLHRGPAPDLDWLPDLAEMLVGRRINATGVVETIAPADSAEFIQSIRVRERGRRHWHWLQPLLSAP